ncbi:KAP family P-loop NTPase fold protein [Marinomonas sp. TW1]|uniref:KAP family P-loop NTPase fold protein n=1 Tax=Marinomonas sp. TW1 TaxID=1561203 RepID=UPI0007AEE9FA|nr:P-loop NTPase fold protein [Marinomonas sp. TW1]KZN13893.1 NTPase KAP [Marinomonas sp. TW1]
MPEKIALDWSNKDVIEEESFPRDTLNRAKYAEFLTQFLVGQGYDTTREPNDEKRNYVLNLNSEWGSGKTYFLKRWSHDLKAHFPVVYIDAWQQDYSDDPLMTAVSSIIKQLRDQAKMPENSPKFQLPKKALGLLKAALPGFAKSVAKRYLDIDLAALMQANDESELEKVKDENGNLIDMGDLASTMVKQLIDEHDGKKKAINDLKIHVANWVKTVTETQELTYPAFIFIDELDRCRPNYAVEMLETIKHIFDIKGIVFVVATDTEQLQHAVKAIYGEGFDARLYLGRFFNSRFSLKAPDLKSFLEVHTDISKLSGEYLANAGIQILPPNENAKVTLSNISMILGAFKMPPRTAIQIADRVVATISNMPNGSKIDILMLTTLLCLNEEDHKRFQDIVAGRFEYKSKGGKDIFLSGYLSERFEQNNGILKIQINPSEDSNAFKNPYKPTCTHYPAGLYETSFNDYLKKLFSSHCGSQNNFLGFLDLNREADTQTPFERIQEELRSNYNQPRKENKPLTNSGLLWLQAHYYKDKFDQVSIEKYRDYVELASALDLIEEDTKHD